jgi:hypothetical protein
VTAIGRAIPFERAMRLSAAGAIEGVRGASEVAGFGGTGVRRRRLGGMQGAAEITLAEGQKVSEFG